MDPPSPPALPCSLFNKRWRDKMSNEQRHVHVRKLPLRPSQNGARHCAQPGRLELSGTEAGEGVCPAGNNTPWDPPCDAESDASSPGAPHAHGVRKGLWWVPKAVNIPTMATGALGGGCQGPPHPEPLCELGTLPQPGPEAPRSEAGTEIHTWPAPDPEGPNRTEEGSRRAQTPTRGTGHHPTAGHT